MDFHQNADNPSWAAHKAVYDCPFSDDWKAWSATMAPRWTRSIR
nr:YfdQ family protein [Citrobacter amalonaticus]